MSESQVPFIPAGFHSVTPYLIVADIEAEVQFMKQAFDAVELQRIAQPDGTLLHVQVRVGDSPIMVGGAQGGDWPPQPSFLYLYVPDADAAFERALSVGATVLQPMHDAFYGDRSGGVRDAQGVYWWFATQVEELEPEELQRRAAQHRPS